MRYIEVKFIIPYGACKGVKPSECVGGTWPTDPWERKTSWIEKCIKTFFAGMLKELSINIVEPKKVRYTKFVKSFNAETTILFPQGYTKKEKKLFMGG